MSRMLAKMNLISVVQQLSNEDIELVQNYVEMIEKENQELKKHLEVPETCNLKTLEDYKSYYEDTTKEQMLEDTYIEYCAYVNLAHRYSGLKKQLEVSNELVAQGTLTEMKLRNEVNRWRKEYQDTYKDVRIEIKEYKTQQKEFIKYLEDEIERKRLNATCTTEYNDYVIPLRVVLQKYKEIIGTIAEQNQKR